MRPVCVTCQREMQCTKTGVLVKAAENYYFSGDAFTCQHCGQQVIAGFSKEGFPVDNPDEVKVGSNLMAMCTEGTRAVSMFIQYMRRQSEWEREVLIRHVRTVVGMGELKSPGSSDG